MRPEKRELKRQALADRRSVLLLGASAIAQVPFANAVHAEANADADEGGSGQLCYLETDHIRAFYARSRF